MNLCPYDLYVFILMMDLLTVCVNCSANGADTKDMSEGAGPSAGVFVGAGVGACVVIVGIVSVVVYCYMKSRKGKAHSNMKKTNDVFSTAASNTQYDHPPSRGRVNRYPDPEQERRARRQERERDKGHVNPAFSRHASDNSSVSSDRDLSPPRVRRGRGGHDNEAFSSESSYDDSSSYEDEKVAGSFSVENETDKDGGRYRSSFKAAKRNDLLDSGSGRKGNSKPRANGGNYRKTDYPDFPRERQSRRDNFTKVRNPRSDSPLTVATLEKHEQFTRESEQNDDEIPRKDSRSRRREASPTRSFESSTVTQTSYVTEGTEFTATTASSGRRYAKNESLRRNSPARSSSHRRYKRDTSTDSKGRRRPRRTRSADDKSKEDRHRRHNHERSRSPAGSSHSGSSHSSRSSRQTKREAKAINKKQADLPIFAATKKK